MFEKLKSIEQRYKELEGFLADPEILGDMVKYQSYAKELSRISPLVEKYRLINKNKAELEALEQLSLEKHDAGFAELAESEKNKLKEDILRIEEEIRVLFKTEDEDREEEAIVEIRAGTGGQEASLFAADLYRMYVKYSDKCNFKAEVLSSHPTDTGGFKEIIFSVSGKGAYKRLKYESGVHRVQRVPTTEASGRIHTSTVTVAVLLEPDEVDMVISPQDLKIDVYRAKGHGGQGVNTTDSAVRITHLPSGMVVTCQDERSQLKNKNKAMKVLRARLMEQTKQKEFNKRATERKSQVGSGERSEKIRTYNFPDRRITDHRVGLTIYKFEDVLEGNIDEFIKALEDLEAKEKQST
ncbi:MAG: peptide chain release factor 1 [Candidatus Omnitrophica bacterium CG11_big_fil_rev_8_21_14_0_20_42_13]|uniref:Peptide chain release factor 1 n=1 Tax=Candidatus Ghiorseimicrobium undicola TaxID=1974746 RepID=A0A2H0LWQ8_9BACT|nr:MAG: peptide chain release factor 1 [Candidatus Omnitrophica bacterium CG11_big_fil_rev_8_21_14_0_20_42_13]